MLPVNKHHELFSEGSMTNSLRRERMTEFRQLDIWDMLTKDAPQEEIQIELNRL